jgi:N-methylhydantoinase A
VSGASARDLEAARTGYREALFSADHGWVQTPVYEMERLGRGHEFPGPALIDSDDTTVVVSPGWTCAVDERSGIVLTQEASGV